MNKKSTDPAALEILLRHDPFVAVARHAAELSDDQISKCIDHDPEGTLMYARDFLKPEHLEYYCEVFPKTALSIASSLSEAQLARCCDKEPEAALRMAMDWNHAVILGKSLLDQCVNAVFPPVALELAPSRLSDKGLQCSKAAPDLALRFAPHLLEDLLLEELALGNPSTALRFANTYLSDELFQRCAAAEPWDAIQADLARVDDETLLKGVRGRAEDIQSSPDHPLVSRLMLLHGRLEPDVQTVVTEAIAHTL